MDKHPEHFMKAMTKYTLFKRLYDRLLNGWFLYAKGVTYHFNFTPDILILKFENNDLLSSLF